MMMAKPMGAGMGGPGGGMACGADAGGCCKDGCCKDGCCCKPGAAMGAAEITPPVKKE